jgi:protein-S-isoprenylcysteine O-methyltransferase Ste14
LVAWWVSSRTKNEKLNNARLSRGTLIASGFIAGGSLFGVVGAFLKFGGLDWFNASWAETHQAEIIGVVMFLVLVAYTMWDSMRAKADPV